jgi:hypothetical protein
MATYLAKVRITLVSYNISHTSFLQHLSHSASVFATLAFWPPNKMRFQTPWLLALCVLGPHAAAEPFVPRDDGLPSSARPAALGKRQPAMAATTMRCTTVVTRTVRGPPANTIFITKVVGTVRILLPCTNCLVVTSTKTVGGGGGWDPTRKDPPTVVLVTTSITFTDYRCSTTPARPS